MDLKAPALMVDSPTTPSPPTTSSASATSVTSRFLSSSTQPTLPPASIAAYSTRAAREETYTSGGVSERERIFFAILGVVAGEGGNGCGRGR
jgi:hypothetical protein